MKINTAEAAHISGCSAATIRRHIQLERLDASRTRTGRYVIEWNEFDNWMSWAWRSGSCFMHPPQLWPGLTAQIQHRQMTRRSRKP